MTAQPFNILAFDTSTTCCSVALIAHGARAVEDTRNGPGNYSALLLQMVDRLLQDASLTIHDINCIAVAQGPGSFTGLRVGISTAQGLGFSLGKPLIGVSTLEIVAAQNMPFPGKICPLLDARRAQVYTSLFDGTACPATAIHEECVICPKQWATSLQQGPLLFCGNGAQVYQDTIKQTAGPSTISRLTQIPTRAQPCWQGLPWSVLQPERANSPLRCFPVMSGDRMPNAVDALTLAEKLKKEYQIL